MSDTMSRRKIALGSGGKNPCFRIVEMDPWSGDYPMFNLSTGDSIYAIALSPDGQSIAFGTRAGNIHIHKLLPGQKAGDKFVEITVYKGNPILSLCWVDNSTIVFSDLNGLYIWSESLESKRALHLPYRNTRLCALYVLEIESLLIGLTSRGAILVWSLPTGRFLNSTEVPPPPRKYACVSLTYWSAAKALVYPGRDGQLIVFDPSKAVYKQIPAHEGTFFSVSLLSDHLLTAGFDEPCIHLWKAGEKTPTKTYTAPEGIVAISALDYIDRTISVIGRSGFAGIYSLEGNTISPLSRIKGGDYRSLLGPSSSYLETLALKRKEQDAHQIMVSLKAQIARRDTTSSESLLANLRHLGFDSEANELQIEVAVAKNDLLMELQARYALAEMLPFTEAAIPNMVTIINILDQYWHFKQATYWMKQVLALSATHPMTSKRKKFTQYAKALGNDGSVLALPDSVSLENYYGISSLLSGRQSYRFPFGRSANNQFLSASFSVDEVIAKIQEMREDSNSNVLPEPEKKRLWFIKEHEVREIDTIVLREEGKEFHGCLELLLNVHPQKASTTVESVIVINATGIAPGRSVMEQNHRILETIKILTNSPPTNWIKTVHEMVVKATKRVANAGIIHQEASF